MRLFELHREQDETGISGTGVVAEGVVFHDGTAALRWKSKFKSTAVYASMDDVVAIHGHNGQTKIVFVGQPDVEQVRRLQHRAVNCPPGEGTDCALAACAVLNSLVPKEP